MGLNLIHRTLTRCTANPKPALGSECRLMLPIADFPQRPHPGLFTTLQTRSSQQALDNNHREEH